MSGEYNQLETLCSEFEMSVEKVEHDETKQSDARRLRDSYINFKVLFLQDVTS